MPDYVDKNYNIRDNQFWYSSCSFAKQIGDKQAITIKIAGLGESILTHSAQGTDGRTTTSFRFDDPTDRQWWETHRGQTVRVELIAINGEAVGEKEEPDGPDPTGKIPKLDREIRSTLHEMPDCYVDRDHNYIWTGFDSAWKGINAGAIAWMTGNCNELVFHKPKEASFEECIHFIDSKTSQSDMHLLMIDQPTIVKNETGFRPVESVVAHQIGRAGSGCQPGNRKKEDMFGESAPIWSFLKELKSRDFQESTADSIKAKRGKYYLETYPAFGNLGLFGYKKCPKYNPTRGTFSLANWKKLCKHVGKVGNALNIQGLEMWAGKMSHDADEQRPTLEWKRDQDFLDAVLCMLFGYVWWLTGSKYSITIGDDKTGYMVAPCLQEGLRAQLKNDAAKHKVPIDKLF